MTDPFDGLRDHARRTPPDLSIVVALGEQRRRRELLGAGVAALAVVAGTVLGLGNGYGDARGLDSLTSRPAPRPTSPQTVAPTAAPSDRAAAPGTGSAPAQADPSPTGVPPLPPPVGPSPTPRPSPKPGEAGMTRTYSGDNPPTVQVGTANLCTTRLGPSAAGSDPYCAEGATDAPDVHGRVPIYGNTCRSGDQVSDGQLSFPTTREMDFAVFQNGKLIWRWSAGRPAAKKQPHTLAVERGRCWVWETQWRAVDSKGKPRRGDFVLRTYAYATELMDSYRETDYQFTL